jgi:hypothetical protein
MGYGMKYTKGGFPFKSSPAKQKTDPPVLRSELDDKGKKLYDSNNKMKKYDMDAAQTADNSGPVRPLNPTVATDARKFEQSELVGELDDKTEYVEADIENKKVSSKEGNEIKKELQYKADKLRSQEYKD